jgi:hypothetical protein
MIAELRQSVVPLLSSFATFATLGWDVNLWSTSVILWRFAQWTRGPFCYALQVDLNGAPSSRQIEDIMCEINVALQHIKN